MSGKLLLESFLQWEEVNNKSIYIGCSGLTKADSDSMDLSDLCLDGHFDLEKVAAIFIEKLKNHEKSKQQEKNV